MTLEKRVMPFFDSLVMLANSVREKTAPREALLDGLSPIEATVAQARKEMEGEARPEFQEEMAELESAFAKFNDGAVLIRKFVEKDDETLLERGLGKVEAAFQEMKKGLLHFGIKKAALSPSKDPFLNLLMSAGGALQRGTCDPGMFANTLTFYEEHLHQIRRTLRRMRRMQESNPEMKRCLEAKPLNDEGALQAVAQIHEFFEGKAYAQMSQPFAFLQRFADDFEGLYQDVLALFDQKKEKKCPRCGRISPAQARTCASCNFVFPDLDVSPSRLDIVEGGEIKQKFVMTYNLEKLLNAVEDYQDDQIGKEQFSVTLDWMDQKLDKAMIQYRSIGKVPEDFLKDSPVLARELKALFVEIVDAYKEGLDGMKQGVAIFRRWMGSRKDEDCTEGVKRVLEGAARVQEAVSRSEKVIAEYQAQKEKEGDEYAGSIS